jgi:hypothetical protein
MDHNANAKDRIADALDRMNTPVSAYNESQLRRIAGYTLSLEKIPLEEFRTSAEVRARFVKLLNMAASDFGWLVEEIHSSHFSLAEIKHLKLNAEEHNPQYEEFIVLGKAAIARFAACFPAIKDIVLDGTHEDIDELDLESFFKPEAEEVMEALQASLSPRPYFV